MLIDIDKIIVENRIRKDFGDLSELADDIKQNGLINPPVVAPTDSGVYRLIAGERRLRAMKLLGYAQVEVRPMSVKDAEHALNLEISENEVRKDFSKSERIDYAKRLERIEKVKAEERIAVNQFGSAAKENFPEPSQTGQTRDIVAEKLGIGSGKQYEKEKEIVENKELLTPEDFADWDEGRLSTNKAYRRIKEQLEAEKLRVMQLESIKAKDEDKIRSSKERLEKEKAKSEKLMHEINGLREELEDAVALTFERQEPERTPMSELKDKIGATEMNALIEAARAGKIIVVENDMDGSVAELAAMMGIRTYESADLFTLSLTDD